MGFWLNDSQIQRIVCKLDYKFSDTGAATGIAEIRATAARRQRFDAGTGGAAAGEGLPLHKIARRMRIWGSPGGPATIHSRRWWGFLLALHSKPNSAAGGGLVAAEDIKKFIRTGLDNVNCVGIKFAAVNNGTDALVRVTSSDISLPLDPTKHVTLIILQTPDHDNTIVQNDPGTTGEDPPGEDLPS